jgi:hypothetical protein
MHTRRVLAMREAQRKRQAAPLTRNDQVFAVSVQMPANAAFNALQVSGGGFISRKSEVALRGIERNTDSRYQPGDYNSDDNGRQ